MRAVLPARLAHHVAPRPPRWSCPGCPPDAAAAPQPIAAAAANLKTSVHNLGNVKVAKNGLDSLQTALSKVQTNAQTFATDAKSAFPSQTTALKNSLSSLETAISPRTASPR